MSNFIGNRQWIKLESVTWAIALFLTISGLYFPPIRYAAYLVPAVALIYGLAEGRFQVPQASKPFLVLLFFGLVLLPLANIEGCKDLFFITSGISIFLVLADVPLQPLWFLCILIVGNLISTLMGGRLSSGISFNVLHSESTFEGVFGYLFGLLCVHSAITRRPRIALLSFLASILVLKRIAIISELICIAFLFIPERFSRKILNPMVMIFANIGVVLILIFYTRHAFDGAITQFTSQSGNQLGMGRQVLYAAVVKAIANDPLKFVFIGEGPGSAYDTLGWTFGLKNLHSDILKICYEYGLLVFCAFIYFGYAARTLGMRILFLYANILYVTDNTLIYHFFIFFYCTLGKSIDTFATKSGLTANASWRK